MDKVLKWYYMSDESKLVAVVKQKIIPYPDRYATFARFYSDFENIGGERDKYRLGCKYRN